MIDDSEFRFEIEFLSGPHDGDVKRLYSEEATIGCEPGVDLVIASDTAVFGKHARIELAADGFWVEDLGSESGTMVNGEKIAEKRKIGQSDVVCVGRTEFICRMGASESAEISIADERTK